MVESAPRAVAGAPHPFKLISIALLCGATGFGVAHASLDVDRAAIATANGEGAIEDGASEAQALEEAGESAANQNAQPANGGAAELDSQANEAAANGAAENLAAANLDAPVQDPVAQQPVAQPIVQAPGGSPGTIIEGRVAYIRCEGLPNVPPSGPCPRDLSVETRVWEAIRALPSSCPALAGREGSVDVRVVFDGPRMSGLGFRDLPDELDRESVRSCLEPTLERVRNGLGTSRLTASFRFELTR